MAEEAAGASSSPATDPQVTAETSPDQPPVKTAADDQPWKKVKHKIKVDGTESELEYDELVRRAQKAAAADKRLAEAAQQRKMLTDAWNSADPSHFFKSKNLDPEQWAEDVLLKKLKLQNMTPEQRAQFEAEQNTKAERDKEKAELEQLKKERQELLTQQVVKQLDTEIVDAFKATGISPDPVLVDLCARHMEAHFDAHEEPLPAKIALERAMDYLDKAVERRLQSLTADAARTKLPKKLLDDLRRQDVELVRSQSPTRQSGNGASQPSTPKTQLKRLSTEEAFRKMEERFSS